jgi:hypothetical protein
MVGTSQHVAGKLAELHDAVGFDRVQALVDSGGLPAGLVEDSVARLATEIARLLRAHVRPLVRSK